MAWDILVIYFTPFVFFLIYKITSAVGFFRTIFMLAGALVFCIFGFMNAQADFAVFSTDWWKSAGIIWAGASVFYMYLFADFSWEPHYYDEYTFIDRLFGTPSIEVREEVDFHWFRWTLISAVMGLATFGLGELLQDILIGKNGYLMCGFIGLVFLLIYIGRIVTKIVHSRR